MAYWLARSLPSVSPFPFSLFPLLLSLLLAAPLGAQVPADTAQVPAPDSLHQLEADSLRRHAADSLRRSAADTVSLPPPAGYVHALPGHPAHRRRPARRIALDAPGLLAEVPGSFVYDFGTVGWPDGWSPFGLSPQRPRLNLDGWPFNDPLTGRPRYDLLPLAFLRPLHVGPNEHGAPVGVHTRALPYDQPRPLTELRYRTTSTGLQSIMALHVQRRRIGLLGRPGVLHVLGGYGGHASPGVYPGSRLRRMRQLYTRLRYQQPNWALEISNLHNRRQLGAHAGVVPTGPLFTIYNPFAAAVRNQQARRQTIRNDLTMTVRTRLLPGLSSPQTFAVHWMARTFRYGLPSDTTVAKTNRYGARFRQRLQWGRHHLLLRLNGRTDRWREGNAFPDSLASPQTRLHAALRDSLSFGDLRAVLGVQAHYGDGLTPLTGLLHLEYAWKSLRGVLEGRLAGQPVPWAARRGLGDSLQAVTSVPTGRTWMGRAGLSWQAGWWDAALWGVGQRLTQPLDYVATTPLEPSGFAYATAAQALVGTASVRRAAAALDLGFRRTASRGFYLTVQPTFVQPLAPNASALNQRLAQSRPRFFVRGQLGARYAFFQGDLDLDVSLEGRFWSSMQSRALHPSTGLLVLPPAGARHVGPSGTLDLNIEADVRTATLFLAYENMLSRTALMSGTMLVPIYPFPAQRLRFGVFWPIQG